MAFLITAYDRPDMNQDREDLREAHRRYLATAGSRLLASGALLAEDGVTIVGGASLLDTEDYDEAVRFEAEDPYSKAGLRKSVVITRWRLRWWMGQFDAEGHRPVKEGTAGKT